MNVDRKTGLGGSDMATVLGVDPRRTRLDLYRQKVGEVEADDETEAMAWGRLLEDGVAARYSEVTGRKLRRVRQTVRHRTHEWAMAHLDRRVVGMSRIVEVKCSSADGWGEAGSDEIPEHYLPQVMHYLAISGAEQCDVAALLWGRYGPPRLAVYEVRPDAELIAFQLEQGAAFWTDHVIARVPPDPKSNEECAKRWPRHAEGKRVQVSEALSLDVQDLRRVRDELDRLKSERNELERRIKCAMGDAAELLDFDGKTKLARWKVQGASGFDCKKFRAAHPDLWDAFRWQGEARPFVLSRTDKPEEESKNGNDD